MGERRGDRLGAGDVGAGDADRHRPAPLLVVVALVGLEALLLLGVAGVGAAQTVTGGVGDVVSGVITTVLPAGVAVFLGVCLRALWQGRRWGRAPVVTWQLLQLALGVSAVTGDSWRVGVPLLVVSALVVMLVVSPAVTAATGRAGDPPVA